MHAGWPASNRDERAFACEPAAAVERNADGERGTPDPAHPEGQACTPLLPGPARCPRSWLAAVSLFQFWMCPKCDPLLFIRDVALIIGVARAPHPHQSLPDPLTPPLLSLSPNPSPYQPFGKVSWGGKRPCVSSTYGLRGKEAGGAVSPPVGRSKDSQHEGPEAATASRRGST
eukprot:scaffold2529_cov122-Isochrysis_galbana.AAC.13